MIDHFNYFSLYLLFIYLSIIFIFSSITNFIISIIIRSLIYLTILVSITIPIYIITHSYLTFILITSFIIHFYRFSISTILYSSSIYPSTTSITIFLSYSIATSLSTMILTLVDPILSSHRFTMMIIVWSLNCYHYLIGQSSYSIH
jgi:hypothetical protein